MSAELESLVKNKEDIIEKLKALVSRFKKTSNVNEMKQLRVAVISLNSKLNVVKESIVMAEKKPVKVKKQKKVIEVRKLDIREREMYAKLMIKYIFSKVPHEESARAVLCRAYSLTVKRMKEEKEKLKEMESENVGRSEKSASENVPTVLQKVR